jgi:hypothetical protein
MPTGPDTGDTVLAAGEPIEPIELVEPAPSGAAPRAADGFYSFRLGSHPDSVTLDRPAYIGRSPSAPRVQRGPSPRLVRVASAAKEVSATHLEIRQLGASVIVTDLNSTNGSVVMLPGSVPRKLRQGESVVVSPGTLVDIGDDNILHILPVQRVG